MIQTYLSLGNHEHLSDSLNKVITLAMNEALVIRNLHELWERLTKELSGILDAHGVCAAVAYEIAVTIGVSTVVGLSVPQESYIDVWVCTADGNLRQTRWEGRKASFEGLLVNGRAIYQQKYELPAGEVINSELWLLARDVVLCVPLPFPAGRQNLVSLGALCLVDPPAGCILTPQTLEPLAMHLTTFLERAFLRQRADQQEVESGIVYDLTNSLSATLSLENIFDQINNPIRRMLNVETISIGLVEKGSGDIVFVQTFMGPLFKQLPTVRIKGDQGIAGWVATHGQPLIINNAYKDERFFAKIDLSSGFRTQSMLCVPLMVEQQVIGVMEAINKQSGYFSENDQRLMLAVAGPLATAIENARLHADVLAEKRRIETIFSSMAEGMLTVNGEGWMTAWNEALLMLLGQEGRALSGRKAKDLIQLRAGIDFATFINQVIQAKEDSPQLAGDLIQPNGQNVPVLISGASIRNEEGQTDEMIFVFSDLRQIREVERMRDDFFHNIIHELRTPLATILMYARLLRSGKAQGDTATADRFLGVIERESDRLQRMVRQMLELAKLEAREIQRSSEVVNLNLLFEEMLPPLADQATQKGLAFSQRVATNLPKVMGNDEMLYSVFKNLVENAIKFTLSGIVRVEAILYEEMVQVKISDDGIGIPKAALPNLFKRFYRTQTAVERGIAGTGLGLYMVKEAVEKHNGTIEVYSVEGKGTTFTVRLPILSD